MLVYVSGPYSAPTLERREQHVAQAIEAGRQLLSNGMFPMIPHLNHLYSQHFTRKGEPDLSHEQYLEWDEEILARCDAMWKLGDSPGADHEEAYANEADVPVVRTLGEVLRLKKEYEEE